MDNIPTSLVASKQRSSSNTHRLKATGVQGLYVEKNAGTYYARYSLKNGKRCVRCLNTTHFEVARLRHAKLHPVHEVARQTGVQPDTSLRTLGSLAAWLVQEIELASSAHRTKVMYLNWISRLRTHWQQGDFDSTLARNVTRETILKLRVYLQNEALTLCGQWKDRRKGYSSAVVNQTLSMLRIILKTAVIKNVIAANPFSEESPFSAPLYLPRESRVPEIPSNETLEQVFQDMAQVDVSGLEPASAQYFITRAENSAEFARFLAYSGLRAGEAAMMTVDNVQGNFLLIRGTRIAPRKRKTLKTETSERKMPINAPLRALLNQILAKRIGGPLLGVKNCLKALQRSCKRLGLDPIRQHDLRHYFATLSIESGVLPSTVSRWIGHKDGGSLLFKTYGHLRDEHSEQSAALIQLPPAQSNPA